ncbi:MAG: enoyl-CoA hydratase-related protein, partial [Hyphomonadaceae bacterium]
MKTTTFETIRLEIADRIALVTLNRPERMNAYTVQMMLDVIKALDMTDADDEVGAVIVTGAGRAFCAGADLAGGGDTFDYEKNKARDALAPAGDMNRMRDGGGRLSLRIFESLKPVIAAVNGAAVGVGATMQLAMDVRLASTAARYGFVFGRRGMVPEACSSWFLPRLVGPQTALEWCLTGRVFSAAEAKERGLVHAVHVPDDLLPAARALAREIVDNTAPVSAALTRHMLWRML